MDDKVTDQAGRTHDTRTETSASGRGRGDRPDRGNAGRDRAWNVKITVMVEVVVGVDRDHSCGMGWDGGLGLDSGGQFTERVTGA